MAHIESERDGATVSVRPVGNLTRYPEVHALIEKVGAVLMDESVTAIQVDLVAVSDSGPLAVGALAALEMMCRQEGRPLSVVGVWGSTREMLQGEGISA